MLMTTKNECHVARARRKRLGQAWRDVRFSVAEARRALPYVDRVLRDAAHALAVVQDARLRLAVDPDSPAHDRLIEQRDQAICRLNETIDECHAVGVAYLDLTRCLVAFRSSFRGREVLLIWRLGDAIDTAWSSIEDPELVC